MKYLVHTLMPRLTLRETSLNQKGTVHFIRPGFSIVLCLSAIIIGFNVAVAINLLSGALTLPLDAIICVFLLSFLLFLHIKFTPTAHFRNPKEIDAIELLGRDSIPMDVTEVCPFLKGQVILVTGAAGSIGSELCRQLLDCEPHLLIAFDSNETGLFDLVEGLRSHSHPHIDCLYPFIGDITDVQRMSRLFAEKRPELIFHAAAYKHVPLLEQYPDLAIRTNALATYHLCRLAQEYEVARFVFISTDKAAEPVSIMGASKRLGEMIVQSLATSTSGVTRFCSVRFGNVIGSRGSVVPVFTQQIEQGGPLTVTDPEATRYFMTIPEACGLVILVSAIAEQGKLYLLNMGEPMRILDLAGKMISLCGLHVGKDISIVYTGLRPGERVHETLVAADEVLVPTSNSNILCVTQRAALPSIEMIVQWINYLEKNLQNEQNMELREQLFSMVKRSRVESYQLVAYGIENEDECSQKKLQVRG